MSVDSVGTVHSRQVGALKQRQGGYDPRYASFACGCVPVLNRFLCPECKRWVGWCMGCDDDDPEICDNCWARKQGGA